MSEKPVALLLHGVTSSASAWDDVALLLADDHELIVPTAAGHRGGPAVSRPATIAKLTDETERLLDARDLEAVHVVGNSMGGWMGIELARRGRALTVCAFSPAGFWGYEGRNNTGATSRLHRARRLATLARPIAPIALGWGTVRKLSLRDVADHADRLTRAQAVEYARDAAECPAAEDILSTTDSQGPLDPLPCPILLAWAAHDRLFPPARYGATAQERLPGATYRVLPDVGHVPMIDDPELCATTIRDWIAQHTAA